VVLGDLRSVFVAFSRIFLLGILMFKRLTARRLYKSFGVKGLNICVSTIFPPPSATADMCAVKRPSVADRYLSVETLCLQRSSARIVVNLYGYFNLSGKPQSAGWAKW
jgi:hypothetical protein